MTRAHRSGAAADRARSRPSSRPRSAHVGGQQLAVATTCPSDEHTVSASGPRPEHEGGDGIGDACMVEVVDAARGRRRPACRTRACRARPRARGSARRAIVPNSSASAARHRCRPAGIAAPAAAPGATRRPARPPLGRRAVDAEADRRACAHQRRRPARSRAEPRVRGRAVRDARAQSPRSARSRRRRGARSARARRRRRASRAPRGIPPAARRSARGRTPPPRRSRPCACAAARRALARIRPSPPSAPA